MPNKLISIEGNIGAGKSTIINYLKTNYSENIIFVDEPVNEWINICNKEGQNALDLFYSNKEENSFWFQILAYITRLRNLLNVIENNTDKIIITERSIYTDHYVFASMLYDSNFLSEMEWKTYKYWFDTFDKITSLDIIIYVNTKPEECYCRINKRNRPEEKDKIPLDYLKKCYEKHENWINNSNVKTIKINGNNSIENVQNDVSLIINDL